MTTLPPRYVCTHCGANPTCRDEDVWHILTEAGAVGMMCKRCGKVTYVQLLSDTPPNGAASTGASTAAGDTSAPAAALVVHDCRECRHWEVDTLGDERDCAPGVCHKLRMVSLAKAGGCSFSFVQDRRRHGRR